MSGPIMFNRRVGKNDVNSFIDFFDTCSEGHTLNREQATKFLLMDNTIGFLSSVEDKTIGAVVVYRDRTRLGMVLAAIAMMKQHRDLGAYAVIKSSLPFFRTVAIRDIDVIVSKHSVNANLNFPFAFCQPTWTRPVLERIGFVREHDLFSYTMKIPRKDLRNNERVPIDAYANLEGARSIIWDEGKTLGLTNSIIWMSLDFAVHSNTLHTISYENSTQLVFSLLKYDDFAIVGLVAPKGEFVRTNRASEVFSSIIKNTQVSEIRFPLIGHGQEDFLKGVSDKIGGSLKKQSITLMRRRL